MQQKNFEMFHFNLLKIESSIILYYKDFTDGIPSSKRKE